MHVCVRAYCACCAGNLTTPRSAWASAGESFTPSPIMQTTSPRPCSVAICSRFPAGIFLFDGEGACKARFSAKELKEADAALAELAA